MKRRTIPIILGAIILSGIIAIVVIYVSNTFIFQGVRQNIIDPSTYQAVFLDNNQTYFGHLKNINSDFLVLSDVYYVQLQEVPSKKNVPTQAPTGRLVKLGETEPHGPKNEMFLNKGHVLFWENLSSGSQIVRTIQNLKTQK